MLGLRLALTAPGAPVRSTAELVTRLDPSWLERAWQGHTGTLSLIRGPMKNRLGDVALRAPNLAAALGPAWDGDWRLDDVDVALFTVPTLANPKDGDACMRVLIAAYGQWLTTRQDRRPSLLMFDEFSAMAGVGRWPSTWSSAPARPAPGCCCQHSRPWAWGTKPSVPGCWQQRTR
jgi:hypothetical protein